MEVTFHGSIVASSLLFLYYGLTCLLSDGMVDEFERFGLARFRTLTGGLEVLGALGLVAGYQVPWVTVVSSAGLSILMLAGVATRLRMRDSLAQTLPALVLLLVNLFIFSFALRNSPAG